MICNGKHIHFKKYLHAKMNLMVNVIMSYFALLEKIQG